VRNGCGPVREGTLRAHAAEAGLAGAPEGARGLPVAASLATVASGAGGVVQPLVAAGQAGLPPRDAASASRTRPQAVPDATGIGLARTLGCGGAELCSLGRRGSVQVGADGGSQDQQPAGDCEPNA
jgi:hypothetical protein